MVAACLSAAVKPQIFLPGDLTKSYLISCGPGVPGSARVAPGCSLIQSPLCSHQFSGVIGFIFFLELTAAVLAVVFQDPLRDWISDFFLANVKAYREDIDLQNLIDSLQRLVRQGCCVCACVCVHLCQDSVLYYVGQQPER